MLIKPYAAQDEIRSVFEK